MASAHLPLARAPRQFEGRACIPYLRGLGPRSMASRLALLFLLVIPLAGCLSGGDATGTAAPGGGATTTSTSTSGSPDVEVPAPGSESVALDIAGTIWIPSPSGSEQPETSVPFRLNGTADVHATVSVASTITPVPTADVVAQLRDASGKVLAEAMFWPPVAEPSEQDLDADALPAGDYELHFAMWGGSDGSSSGDRIDYRIEAQDPAST